MTHLIQGTVETACRNCKGKEFAVNEEEGDTICRSCGLVTGWQLLDARSSYVDNELQFNQIYGSSKDRMKRSKDSNQMTSLFESRKAGGKCLEVLAGIRSISSSLSLNHAITEYACSSIEILDEIKRIPRRYDPLILSGAAIFHSCCNFNVMRTLDEIAHTARLNKMEISRACTTLKKLQAPFENELINYVATNNKESSTDHTIVEGTSSNLSGKSRPLDENVENTKDTNSSSHKAGDLDNQHQRETKKIKSVEATDVSMALSQPLETQRTNEAEDEDGSAYALSLSSIRAIPEQIIPRFCKELKIKSKSLLSLSCEVSKLLIKSGLLEAKQLKLQAASSIYMSLLLYPKFSHIGVNDIIKACSLSPVPFKAAYKLLFQHWRLLIPNEVQAKLGENTLKDIYEH